jgi:hypothetical protein
MAETDKKPLEQRTTEELEHGLAQGVFRERKRALVEQILRERRRDDSVAEKKSDARRDRWKLLAYWTAGLAALGTLIWTVYDSLWR